MQAVILAGGYGTRLRPLTDIIPKPMVAIKGRPFLEYQIEMLKRHQFKDMIICVGHLGHVIENYFGDGKKFGVTISYSYNNQELGTAGALKNTEQLLEKEFVLAYGDSFLDIDYQKLIVDFKKTGKTGMSVVFASETKIAPNNMQVAPNHTIVKYDKKNETDCNYVEAGVHVFKKDILQHVSGGRAVSLEEEIFPVLIQKKELVAHPTNIRFYDIGTPERLKEFIQII